MGRTTYMPRIHASIYDLTHIHSEIITAVRIVRLVSVSVTECSLVCLWCGCES